MYRFIKTQDTNNEYDNSNVVIEVVSNDTGWPELLDEFKRFLTACGYVISKEAIEEHLRDSDE